MEPVDHAKIQCITDAVNVMLLRSTGNRSGPFCTVSLFPGLAKGDTWPVLGADAPWTTPDNVHMVTVRPYLLPDKATNIAHSQQPSPLFGEFPERRSSDTAFAPSHRTRRLDEAGHQ